MPEPVPVSRGGCLAVFDLDGTLTRHDTLVPYLFGVLLRRPWRLPRLALALPAALRYLRDRDRGALKSRLIRSTLGGLARATLERRSECFVRRLLRSGLYTEALEAIAAHRARGDRLLLMSASPDLYVPRIAQSLGFDGVICTRVRWRGDRLDGRLDGRNCRGAEKRERLAALLARDHPAEVAAYGNSAADLDHMALAQRGYLVNAPRVAQRRLPPQVQRLRWRQRFRGSPC